jgi:hypothetical protein
VDPSSAAGNTWILTISYMHSKWDCTGVGFGTSAEVPKTVPELWDRFLGPDDLFLGDPFGVGPGGSKTASTLVGIVCIVESPRDLPYRDIIVPANIIIANLYPHMVHLSLIQQ